MDRHPGTAGVPSRIDRLRVRHFKLLELICAHGSLTAAAEVLGISQPSATKLLHDMERALRCKLVDRSTRGGVLTQAGVRALERLRVAIHAIDAATEAVAAAPGRPLVRVGILRLAGVSILPHLVRLLDAASCLPRLQLHEGAVSGLMAQLQAGEIDCIIGRLEPAQEDHSAGMLDITLLHNDPYEVACAPDHSLARKRQVGLETLAEHPWIAAPRQTYTRQAFETAFMNLGVPPPIPIIESPSFHASFAILAQNPSFLTVAPRSSVQYYALLGKVRPVRLATPFPEDRMVFITRRELLRLPAVADIKHHVLAVGG